MSKLPKKIVVYFSLFISILLLIVFPLQANQVKEFIHDSHHQQNIIDKSENITYLALSWGDMLNALRRKKGTGASRGGNDTICLIVPEKLKEKESNNQQEDGRRLIWSEKPLFLVQGNVNEIVVGTKNFPETEEETMWTYRVPQSNNSNELITHSIVYNGKPLQPNKEYSWTNMPSDNPKWARFKMMNQKTKEIISNDLKSLEETLQSAENSKEKIAKERVKYFAERKLWSDSIREMYSNQEIFSEEIKAIESHQFCEPKPEPTSDT
ncbi:hypothetical protein [Crocosphaera sp.]|uniref:hypothetical protein n=1 Tax=Crocosphaera sp. TaxID=2729996 RepID=UPI0026392A48|nr:hypothetical protein [Crocosphaera sp.]MDJ0583215.1 hypothetical protein [Crocosphaera sp.]